MGPPLWPSPKLHAMPGLRNRRILSGRREQAGNNAHTRSLAWSPQFLPNLGLSIPLLTLPHPPQFQACLLPAARLSSTGVTTAPSAWWSPAPTPFPIPVPGPTSTWRCSTTVSPTVSHLVPHADAGPSPFQKRVRRRHLERAHTHTHTQGQVGARHTGDSWACSLPHTFSSPRHPCPHWCLPHPHPHPHRLCPHPLGTFSNSCYSGLLTLLLHMPLGLFIHSKATPTYSTWHTYISPLLSLDLDLAAL